MGIAIVYSQIETVVSGRVRTVQEWGGGPDDVTDAEDEAGRVDRWREEKEMRTALANAAPNMPATSAGQTNKQTNYFRPFQMEIAPSEIKKKM